MSAQAAFSTEERQEQGPRLTLVPPLRSTVSTVGFALIIMALVAVGMGLVMVVTTSVAAQSKELSGLRTEATLLEYRTASLTTELQTTSATGRLATRAADLGMVPNPYPAFIRLSDGKILGEPTPVRGNEVPYLRQHELTPPTAPRIRVLAGQDDAAAPTPTLPMAPGVDQ
ncbi:hypothetical protein [Tessaracoccus antarcticus]|uniref:Cell division protein FtsL n=1 Tax=Tessaracoccus antarcticus TaxID=2479848 RepID=A0A3M0G536_9ACTN|nr:hypothetical protein [Tessaracoccus antarcticus]RMB59688.1 hypothetical protein EAX62_07960 [Tessaracoccus antarcticus]